MYDEKRAFARRNRRVRPSLPAYRPAAEASLHSECS